MKVILTVARREITRLKSRFSGKSRAIVFGVMALAIAGSFVMYHQDLAVSKGLYTIGTSPNSPIIEDSRFRVTVMDLETGKQGVDEGSIDLYIDDTVIFRGSGERAAHAASALGKYLQKTELITVAEKYEINEAFPLRIKVTSLDREDPGRVAAAEDSATDGPAAAVTSDGVTFDLPGPEQERDIPSDSGQVDGNPDNENTNPVQGDSSVRDRIVEATTGGLSGETETGDGPTAPAADVDESTPAPSSTTDEAIRQQLEEFIEGGTLPEFKAEFVSENDIIVPSLMSPPIPLAQVIIAFLYIVPVFFISLFFTSSFTEEKISRKLIILLSAPVTRLQVILGKMAPYLAYSILVIVGVTLTLRGNLLLGLAIFTPVMLFIFAIYLMVALTYRTFKDQTFFSVLALSIVTVYLVGPAMFTGVNDLSYISPLTLAVEMYRGETFSISQYFLSTTPLLLVFGTTVYVGTRVLNEEYLMGFRPLHRKIAEAIFYTLDRAHINISMFLMSMAVVPVVMMVQLAALALVSNLPIPFMMGALMIISVVVEEVAKSVSVVVLAQNRALSGVKEALRLAVISAVGFMIMEKLLLFVVLSVVDDSMFISALSDGGMLLLPLVLHVVSTSIVCVLVAKFGTRFYPLGLLLGSVIHLAYNLAIVGSAL